MVYNTTVPSLELMKLNLADWHSDRKQGKRQEGSKEERQHAGDKIRTQAVLNILLISMMNIMDYIVGYTLVKYTCMPFGTQLLINVSMNFSNVVQYLDNCNMLDSNSTACLIHIVHTVHTHYVWEEPFLLLLVKSQLRVFVYKWVGGMTWCVLTSPCTHVPFLFTRITL